MTRSFVLLTGAMLLLVAAKCDGNGAAAVADGFANVGRVDLARDFTGGTRSPRTVVDSALPMEELMRRFRAGLEEPRELSGGATSRQELVHEFRASLERADTAALDRLRVTRAEYAFLVLPFSPLLEPPYSQPPEIAWLLLRSASDKGFRRLLARHGGRDLPVEGVACDELPLHEGANRIWRNCALRIRALQGPARQRLFGAILERGGHFKFLSYANDL